MDTGVLSELSRGITTRIIPHFSNGTRDLAEGSTIFLILSTRARYKKNTLICESRAEKQTIFDSAIFFLKGKNFKKFEKRINVIDFLSLVFPPPLCQNRECVYFALTLFLSPISLFFLIPRQIEHRQAFVFSRRYIYIYIATQTPLRRPRGMTRAGVEGEIKGEAGENWRRKGRKNIGGAGFTSRVKAYRAETGCSNRTLRTILVPSILRRAARLVCACQSGST